MTSPQRRRALEIFLEVNSASPDERDAAIESACKGDPELRTEVERLIEQDDIVSSTVHAGETTNWNSETTSRAYADLTGRTIGDYELISELGRGGMGVVYRAR